MFYNPWLTPQVSERNLPHWHQDGVIYFVTFRLADSIPTSKIRALQERRQLWDRAHKGNLTEDEIAERDELFSAQIDHWLDQGTGECLLQNATASKIVRDALHFYDGKRHHLDACVVMPNHVHLLIQPTPPNTLSKILHSIKSFTAHEINKCVQRKGKLWQDESYDRIVRSPEERSHYREYIRRNPEVAKVSIPENALYLSTQPDA